MQVHPGDVLAGKYRVDRVLGRGGIGIVVAAWHLQLDQLVAIKLLLPEHALSQNALSRFAREARAAARLKSEHVARVLDVDALPDGAPFIVMEYLEGRDLAAVLEVEKELPVERAVVYVLQVAEAIAEAHAAGIVHRDLKPANLFVTQASDGSPCIKVLDFGISKTVDRAGVIDASLTNTSSLTGSPLYMSPEQLVRPREVDARTDLWSLGVVLHELVTGAPPFYEDTLTQLLMSITQAEPRSLRADRPTAPRALEQVVLRCLEKEPSQRFDSALDLARALEPLGGAASQGRVARIERVVEAAAQREAQRRRGAPSEPETPRVPSQAELQETLDAAAVSMPPRTLDSGDHGSTLRSVSQSGSERAAPVVQVVRPSQRRRSRITTALVLLGGVALGAAVVWWIALGRQRDAAPSSDDAHLTREHTAAAASGSEPASSLVDAAAPEVADAVEPAVEPAVAPPSGLSQVAAPAPAPMAPPRQPAPAPPSQGPGPAASPAPAPKPPAQPAPAPTPEDLLSDRE